MPRQLTITPASYKSSLLSIPPTPFSPLLPITPPASPPKYNQGTGSRAAKLKASAELLPPPPESLHWLWQCHKCNRVYQLGVTRRCLDDGHFFCAGTTVVKRGKKGNGGKRVVRHAACASEFDYQGWKAWGNWRRAVVERVEAADALMVAEEIFEREMNGKLMVPEGRWFQGRWTTKREARDVVAGAQKKDCWMKCDYPSECRWGKQFGVQSTTTPKVANATVPSSPIKAEEAKHEIKAKTSFEEILGISLASSDITDETASAAVDFLEPLSPTRSSSQKAVAEGETKSVSMDDLLESAKRRKRRSSGQIPSPLGANPPEEVKGEIRIGMSGSEILQKAFDDIELDLKKGLGSLLALEEKADAFVKGLNVGKKR
ncbi:uncharacterized protein MYCFIDRAFT_77101 [Pseudocercospora fijiensis CIRAD86]|uniref:Uncharacterized protein n=1 Tax=Pseudocercospora fijiensis (strain CIRAD86) TaxID=383855 RepID=M3AUN2_PSEFD|nr:uncharacterized protein MYCFIDRAFT_77101 [Pseudocercospora fijiensis CIRAD86]EME81182.1 hypothetical protein MYCFIDRAFT_77101 [Pseudocercospora fijiensis CIRAD86]